jgi:hypothetical protein
MSPIEFLTIALTSDPGTPAVVYIEPGQGPFCARCWAESQEITPIVSEQMAYWRCAKGHATPAHSLAEGVATTSHFTE